MKTFKQLTDEIRRQVWPSGEPENLVLSHSQHLQEGMAKIAEFVEAEQENVVSTFEFCKTFFKCGMTVIPAPDGVIKRVFTVCQSNGTFCDAVLYRPVDWPQPECDGRRVLQLLTNITPTAKRLPLGFTEADPAFDASCGRARVGVWARHQDNIYIAPFIQSTEMVVVEWDGIKNVWEDSDPVSESQGYRAALKFYLQHAHERDYGSIERAMVFHNPGILSNPRATPGQFDVALAELMKRQRDIAKRPAAEHCIVPPCRCLLETNLVNGCTVPTTEGALVVAHIGSFGSGNSDEAAVAALVDSFGASAVIGSAPNAFNVNLSAQNYDDEVGKFYHKYIFPYVGAYGDGGATNGFWPSPGSTDWSVDGNLSSYLAFFPLPDNRRYYDVCLGPVHLFVLDGDTSEPDGTGENSIQANWLKAKLWLSTAPWKVVVLGDSAPYLTHGGTSGLRWSFKSWGANLVLSGFPVYERSRQNGLDYINNGSGGKTITGTGNTPIAGREYYDETHFGAGRMIATQCSLRYEFIGVDGVLIDALQLTKPLTGACAGETVAGELTDATIQQFLPASTESEQQFFTSNGDPNGVVTAGPLPAQCWDMTNHILLVRLGGSVGNTGWF